ncbi:MAG: TonB-dependent receptor, partial [Mucinivorans sp.]
MKRTLLFLSLAFISLYSQAEVVDSMRMIDAEQVVVRSSSKETNKPWSTPSSISVISPFKVTQRGISGIKDLSTMVPNFFIPDYGSKMTTPVYLRGVGARSSGQSVGMYVDNIPYMDKSTFDFEFGDIQRIEVLRGPQGTLYGRNAMGGIINVYTLSPFDYQGTRLSIGAGSYGQWSAKGSTYHKLSKTVALSAAAYWDRQGGFFTNEYTGKKVDEGQNAGGRIKLDLRLSEKLSINITSVYDYTNQGAFAYGLYDKKTNEIAPVNYNDQGSYLRNMSNNSVRVEYKTPKILFSSNTGYQWLNDNMWMDQDFTSRSVFTINQRQLQNSINQEFSVKSNDKRNYQWSVGAFGFYNALNTVGDVVLKEDFVGGVLQKVFDNMVPKPMKLTIKDSQIPNQGSYETPTTGVAIFHQSTFNNLITKGLSLTIGLRLDYEKQFLDYNTSMSLNTTMSAPFLPKPMDYNIARTLAGTESQDFFQWLPKLSIKYECTPNIMTYATVSKGYKTGGYNIQMFSEVIQDSLKTWRPKGMPPAKPLPGGVDLKSTISYRPEITWNYEIGSRASFWNNLLTLDLSLFYMDIQDLQLTQFIAGGSGRFLTNAGRASSCGVELAV